VAVVLEGLANFRGSGEVFPGKKLAEIGKELRLLIDDDFALLLSHPPLQVHHLRNGRLGHLGAPLVRLQQSSVSLGPKLTELRRLGNHVRKLRLVEHRLERAGAEVELLLHVGAFVRPDSLCFARVLLRKLLLNIGDVLLHTSTLFQDEAPRAIAQGPRRFFVRFMLVVTVVFGRPDALRVANLAVAIVPFG